MIYNIKSELDIQSKHPHIKTHINSDARAHMKMGIAHELYYKQNGRYPDSSGSNKIPEDIREKALEIEDRLIH